MTYSEERKSLSFLVLKHCAVPVGMERRNAWERITSPTIASKYASMRCNVSNELKKMFWVSDDIVSTNIYIRITLSTHADYCLSLAISNKQIQTGRPSIQTLSLRG